MKRQTTCVWIIHANQKRKWKRELKTSHHVWSIKSLNLYNCTCLMKYTQGLTYMYDTILWLIHIMGLFNQMFMLTHSITTVSDTKINFIWMIWTERMNTWINRCCSSGILVALLAVASVTVVFLLLQSNVSVSQAVPVEALWDCCQVGQFLSTKCWVSLMCQTVWGVRWYVPQTWKTQSGLRPPDRRHSWWASAEGSNRVDTLLLRTRSRDHGSAPVWTYSMHCCTCH